MPFPRMALSEWLLRIGVALAFLYPAIAAWGDPYSWVGYFPTIIQDLVSPHSIVLLHVFGAVEIALALWILFGRRVFVPASIASVFLLAIVVANTAQFPILFRDVSIALMALSLAVMHRTRHE